MTITILRTNTRELIDEAREVLEDSDAEMMLRQCFYQVVVRQLIENSKSSYRRLGHVLAEGRKLGLIPCDRIEDCLRRPRRVAMWDGIPAFANAVANAYRRDVWLTQPTYLHVWLGKDALSGVFEDKLDDYGVTLTRWLLEQRTQLSREGSG